ncbi:MAG: hypothetical protein KDB61_14720 [Planctomycetes bacterium]|nr:hypothetical protein [Planctomycetota bacterium]
MMTSPDAIKEELEAQAHALGFDLFGVAPAQAVARPEALTAYIEKGFHGEMEWLAREPERRTEAPPRYPNLVPESRRIGEAVACPVSPFR